MPDRFWRLCIKTTTNICIVQTRPSNGCTTYAKYTYKQILIVEKKTKQKRRDSASPNINISESIECNMWFCVHRSGLWNHLLLNFLAAPFLQWIRVSIEICNKNRNIYNYFKWESKFVLTLEKKSNKIRFFFLMYVCVEQLRALSGVRTACYQRRCLCRGNCGFFL